MDPTIPRRDLPKIELHCHVDGIVDPAILRTLLGQGTPLPLAVETLQAAYPVHDFASFMAWFAAVRPLQGSLHAFKPILALHMERLRSQHVVYTEVMLRSHDIPADSGRAAEEVAGFRAWTDGQQGTDLRVEYLVCLNRTNPPELVDEHATRALRLYNAGLVAGVALAGPEVGYPVQPFHATFARLHAAGIPIQIHAGEWCGSDAVWDAVQHGYPTRIGHGVSLFDDPRLVELVRERVIHVEMCPTSNLKTRSVERLEDHPIGRARALGLSFSINTDDPGAFDCTMESEYALLADAFGFDEQDFTYVYDCALAARFQPAPRQSAG